MKRYGLYIFLLSMIISCASTPAKRVEIVIKERFPASFEKTWHAIIETMAEKAMPIEAAEKDSRIITTNYVNFASGLTATNTIKKVANTPVETLTSFEKGRYILKAYVTPFGVSSTRVGLTCHIEAFGGGLEGKTWHVCSSKGIMENRFFEALRTKITFDKIGILIIDTTEKEDVLSLLSKRETILLDIKNVVRNYILVVISSYTPMKLNDEYQILRNKNLIGSAKVVQINKSNIALEVNLQNSNDKVMISDKVKYILKSR